MCQLVSVMLVGPLHGYGGWLVIGIQLRCPLSPMTSSCCVGSRVTVLESIVSNRDRTISVVPMTVMALLVAAVVALIGTWRDAVAVISLAMVGVPLRVIGPYVRISAVALSSLVSNAQLVNVLGMRLLVVTCWPSHYSWTNTRRLSLMILAVLSNPLGLPGLRRSWVNLNVLPPK